MTKSKSVRILDMIADSGCRGMRFTDIQRTLWEMSHPDRPFTRAVRGYWCTNLLGGRYYHNGLLHTFAVKGTDGLWRRNCISHRESPWAIVKNIPISYNYWR